MPQHDISVTHGDIQRFANQVRHWAQGMRSLKNQIMSGARQLESSWRDTQYFSALQEVENKARELELSTQRFEEIARQLGAMAIELQKAQQEMQRRINAMR